MTTIKELRDVIRAVIQEDAEFHMEENPIFDAFFEKYGIEGASVILRSAAERLREGRPSENHADLLDELASDLEKMMVSKS